LTDEKPTRKRGRKPDPPPRMFVTLNYMDSNGNRVKYDATGESPDDYPEELKAAIRVKREEIHRDIIMPKFQRWLDGLSPKQRAALRGAARSEDPQIQKQFEEVLLKWYDALWVGKKAEGAGS